MPELRTTILIDAVAITEDLAFEFKLSGSQVPATLSCFGVADSAEDIAIQKNVADSNGSNWATIEEGGTAKVLNGENNALAIDSPGHYRILTADATYASGDVTVVLEY